MLFGPDKYHLPMTLDGAMCDDLTALKTGFACQLPLRDDSGRQMLWFNFAKNTFEGYTKESLVCFGRSFEGDHFFAIISQNSGIFLFCIFRCAWCGT